MTADDIRQTIEASRTGDESERTTADRIVAELSGVPKADVYDLLVAAGLEGLRKYDSRSAMLQRLRNRLTACVRARERNYC